MKNIKKYYGHLVLSALLIIDIIIFLVSDTFSWNAQFWVGFIFIQIPFIGLGIIKLFTKDLFGKNVIDCIFLVYIVAMIFNGLVAFLLPYYKNTFNVLLIVNIIITLLMTGMVVFEYFRFKKINNN